VVEVDVFWSYGLGASFALGAFRQLRKMQAEGGAEDFKPNRQQSRAINRLVKKIESGDHAFNNQYFMKTLLFLSLLFVPSGSNLLWSNPNWETMQVGSYETIPGWLVSGFTITNVTQGILGYWVTYNYLMKGKYYQAALQTLLSYLGFWFILVNGWDKTGYRRFFSRNREAFDDWKWTNVFGWLTSDVMRILLAYGAAFIPLMFYWMSRWLQEGYDTEEGLERPADEQGRRGELVSISGRFASMIFGLTLGSAVLAHLCIRWLGWTIGSTVAGAVIYLLGFSARGLAPKMVRAMLKVEDLEGAPVWELDPVEAELEEMVSAGA